MRRPFLAATTGVILLCLVAAGAPARELSGGELADRLGCLACHSLKGKGGGRGPTWDGLGTRRSPEALKQQIVRPKGRMPNYAHLRPEELAALVEYLSELK